MSQYKHHVFFCCNKRDGNRDCCENTGADRLRAYAKDRIAALGPTAESEIRINRAGCLNRCDTGPVLVVYPDNVWYTYMDESDVDEIIDEHLVNQRVVERLLIS
jgi:(2Fe-2S) ferredoxin